MDFFSVAASSLGPKACSISRPGIRSQILPTLKSCQGTFQAPIPGVSISAIDSCIRRCRTSRRSKSCACGPITN